MRQTPLSWNRETKITEAIIENGVDLRAIGRLGHTPDNIDISALPAPWALARGSTSPAAEASPLLNMQAWMLALASRFADSVQFSRQKQQASSALRAVSAGRSPAAPAPDMRVPVNQPLILTA
ncbi:MAG: hypothetical protein M5U34_43515 [Chloroflexi bacterium]|nr:hypothetical protein [Chloroflexota bacterium]